MKISITISALLLTGGIAWADTGSLISASNAVTERGLHHSVNEHVRVIEKNGRQQSITNRYTTLAAGMHRVVNGELVSADPIIELHPDGAIADKTQHKVKFLANINNWEGSIDLETPDGQRFLSRPLGISYLDGENSVLIAELKDSVGTLFPPNKITYESAFTDFQADLEYNNLLAGLQQNLIFRERPPQPSDFGLNNETAYIEFLTEFFESPKPVRKTEMKNGVEDDRQLDFGSMNIGVGKSFMIGEESRSYSVEKQWIRLGEDGRTFLIERVAYAKIAPLLNTLPLPEQANNLKPDKIRHIASKKRLLPERQVAKLKVSPEIQVASVPSDQKGFVIDYSLTTGSLTNFVFQADKTYVITNRVDLYGVVVLEGGTVLKYRTNALLVVYDSVSCQTDSYRPAVLTSWEDDSAGEWILGSTGVPGVSADVALALSFASDTDLKHLRISYARQAVEFDTVNGTVTDCQFVKCNKGVISVFGELWLRNNLFYQCATALGAHQATIHGENLTVNQSSVLVWEDYEMQVRLTNTLLVAVTNLGITDINATNSNFIWFTNDPGVFQTVGAGSHYLANNSPYRDAGTTNISEELLISLGAKTTYPPIVHANSNYVNNVTLSRAVSRDDDGMPDLGYHYDALDFVLGDVVLDGASLKLTNGVAVGFYAKDEIWAACVMEGGATVRSHGSPENPNHLVWYNTVQEQSNTNWTGGEYLKDMFGTEDYDTGAHLICRFSKFSRLGDGWWHVGNGDAGWMQGSFFEHCEFYGGGLFQASPVPVVFGAHIVNSLFYRSKLWYIAASGDFEGTLRNNLFYGGSVIMYDNSPGYFLVTVENNLFDGTGFDQDAATINDHNAYWNCSTNLFPAGPDDIFLNNAIAYEAGPLGNFYQPTNSPLINEGSTNANLLGLYHFTVTTNQVKETNSVVDIGFHYVATDGNGFPIDTDGDGVPDYFEDSNGNGVVNSGETDWDNDMDLGFEVWITEPKATSNLP